MNIKEAKEQIKNAMTAYFTKDQFGNYRIPIEKQRPVFLMGPPGIGKTAIMEQIAQELDVGLISYSMTHHTRQSALGLPYIVQKEYGGKTCFLNEDAGTMGYEPRLDRFELVEQTDERRGEGVYDRLIEVMDGLHSRGLLFGASVTVTTENLREVTSPAFLDSLIDRGCKLVIYVEFVPVTEEARQLAPGEAERDYLEQTMADLRRNTYPDTLLLSFPGDERATDGCMAAGRGFFHINSHGGAEPCPFSPFSDRSLKTVSLREALRSPLFMALREGDFLDDDHVGGCVLFAKRDQVAAMLQAQK